MTLNISTPFAYYLGHGIIDEIDFTDIRNDERIVWTPNQKKGRNFKKKQEIFTFLSYIMKNDFKFR